MTGFAQIVYITSCILHYSCLESYRKGDRVGVNYGHIIFEIDRDLHRWAFTGWVCFIYSDAVASNKKLRLVIGLYMSFGCRSQTHRITEYCKCVRLGLRLHLTAPTVCPCFNRNVTLQVAALLRCRFVTTSQPRLPFWLQSGSD